MTNTLVCPTELLDFGQYADVHVDAAATSMRGECGWHIAPRLSESVTVPCRGGRELWLPSRAFPDAPVEVSAVWRGAGVPLDGWEPVTGTLWRLRTDGARR